MTSLSDVCEEAALLCIYGRRSEQLCLPLREGLDHSSTRTCTLNKTHVYDICVLQNKIHVHTLRILNAYVSFDSQEGHCVTY